MSKTKKEVKAPKKVKSPAKAKKITQDTVLPKGMNMQGEERVMISQTTMIDGKPVTKTIMKARKYYTDPETGKVIEEAIPMDQKGIEDKTASEKQMTTTRNEMAITEKDLEAAQDSFRASRLDFHDRMMQMRDEMRNLWHFPF